MSVDDEYWALLRAHGISLDPSSQDPYLKFHKLLQGRLDAILTASAKPGTPVFAGSFPTMTLNAVCIRTKSGVLMLVNQGVIYAAFQLATLIQRRVRSDFQGNTVSPDLELDAARAAFATTVQLCTPGQSQSTNQSLLLERSGLTDGRYLFGEFLVHSVLDFILAHELAHILRGHLDPEALRVLAPSTGPLQQYGRSWEREHEADIHAVQILYSLLRNSLPHAEGRRAYEGPILSGYPADSPNVCSDSACVGAVLFFTLASSAKLFAERQGLTSATSLTSHPDVRLRAGEARFRAKLPGPASDSDLVKVIYTILDELDADVTVRPSVSEKSLRRLKRVMDSHYTPKCHDEIYSGVDRSTGTVDALHLYRFFSDNYDRAESTIAAFALCYVVGGRDAAPVIRRDFGVMYTYYCGIYPKTAGSWWRRWRVRRLHRLLHDCIPDLDSISSESSAIMSEWIDLVRTEDRKK